MELSIIIPIYNEESKIAIDIRAAGQFLVDHDIPGEVIVVDNASTDGSVQAAKETAVSDGVRKKIIINDGQYGKGYAVRSGVMQAEGKYVMFADSGLCVPYTNLLKGLNMIKSGECEIAHGSRKLPGSDIKRPQKFLRRVLSSMFKRYAFFQLGIPGRYSDTQCGFKIYRTDVAKELFAESVIDGFLFDIDIMVRALKRGYRVFEFPVEWTSDPDSKVVPRKLAFRVLDDIARIKKDVKQKYSS